MAKNLVLNVVYHLQKTANKTEARSGASVLSYLIIVFMPSVTSIDILNSYLKITLFASDNAKLFTRSSWINMSNVLAY